MAIGKGFWMGITEVTQDQWVSIMGTMPWEGQSQIEEGDDRPAVYISWDQAMAFVDTLNRKKLGSYRLPTEAEWEYAARRGITAIFVSGVDHSGLDTVAWYAGNSIGSGVEAAHPVAQKNPNDSGLLDVSGNVWEWCWDWYDGSAYRTSAPSDPRPDPSAER
ncbi:MAG: formylglycine-generating enzyme family protein [Marinilabiliales bacterium]|nr:formylglycine-generating enzyme family protein [Marinilabiliales bacterium]